MLRFIHLEDRVRVLVADVGKLSVALNGIDVLPEDREELLVSDFGWIKRHLARFAVSSLTG
jgi:hypothetical protein